MFWRGRHKLVLDCVEFAALFSMMVINLYYFPFTKVEESFNLQAVYDLLYKDWSAVSTFDHVDFPGVVPRTFIGPLALTPIALMVNFLFNVSPLVTLHIVRGTLGFLTVLSIYAIRTSLSWRFGHVAAYFFTMVTVSQFHLLFYASRTLPNTFALILMNFAFADRLRPPPNNRPYRALIIMSVACALFRSELCIYIFATLLTDLILGKIEIRRSMAYGLCAAVATALTSIAVDSYFWRRPCYPELEVFYFNVVLNKSSEWGTLPFHWYFTRALPRALGLCYLLALWTSCILFKTLAALVVPAVIFVCMYSGLPHKELRFIFYVLPVFNTVAVVGLLYAGGLLYRVYLRYRDKKAQDKKDMKNEDSKGKGKDSKDEDGSDPRKKSALPRPNYFTISMCIGAFLCGTVGVLLSGVQMIASGYASSANYPSAYAIRAMHRIEPLVYRQEIDRNNWMTLLDGRMRAPRLCEPGSTRVANVHIDVKSATSGISQFLQITNKTGCPQWTYSKREDVDKIRWSDFTHLISERKSVDGFCVIHIEMGLAGIDWRQRKFRILPHTYVHRNMNVTRRACKFGADK